MTYTDIQYTSTQLVVELHTRVMPGEDVGRDQMSFAIRLVKLGRRQHEPIVSCAVSTYTHTHAPTTYQEFITCGYKSR